METLTKKTIKYCKGCNGKFQKAYSDSLNYWKIKIFCSKKCANLYNKTALKLTGTKRPVEVINKMRATMFKKGQVSPMKGKHNIGISGENNHNWKGGITPKNEKIRKSIDYRLWREAVFSRDNFTCLNCFKRGGDLQAHHFKPFALFPELRFAIDNGRSLCKDCHCKIHKKS